jgi:hypothetical protein
VTSLITSHLDLVRLLYLEERDHIRNIRSAAARHGNSLEVRAARASLGTISVKEHRLEALASLGKFLSELEADVKMRPSDDRGQGEQ